MTSHDVDLRVVLVIGGNKGIGLEVVDQLSKRIPSGTILLGSRSMSNAEAAIKSLKKERGENAYDNVKVVVIDVVDQQSLDSAVDKVRSIYGTLDVLVHNSGIGNVNGDKLSSGVFDVNVGGAQKAFTAFLPLIPAEGLMIMVSSGISAWTMDAIKDDHSEESKAFFDRLDDPSKNDKADIDDYIQDWVEYSKKQTQSEYVWPPVKGVQMAYAISKTIITAWTRHFAQARPEVKVALVCPGHCATALNGFTGSRSAAQGAESVVWPIFNDFENGKLYQVGKVFPFSMAMPKSLYTAKE